MANSVVAGFLRVVQSNKTVGPLVVTGDGTASGALTDTQLRASAVPVSAAALPLPTGAATAAAQTDGTARVGGAINAVPATGSVYDAAGAVALTPKFKLLNQAASGTNATLVTAVSGKKIRVLAAVFVAGATATNLTFNSATAGAISCMFANAANGGATLPFNPSGWFETVAGEALAVTTGAGSTTGIQITYVEV